MAKIFQDGFEYLPSTSPSGSLTSIGGWAQAGGVTRQTGRFGGSTYAARLAGSGTNTDTNGSNLVAFLPSTYSRLIGGITFQASGTPSSPTNTARMLSFLNADTGNMNTAARIQVGIGLDITNFAIVAYRGTTEIGRSANNVFGLDIWYRLEWNITFNDSTGAIEIRLNGTAILTLTNVDTNNGLSNVVNAIRLNQFQQSNGAILMWYDDVVVMDNAGSRLNGFIGDVRIDRLAPTADVQAQMSRTGTGLSGNFDAIDEPGVDTANYIEGTDNQEDIYTLSDPPSLNAVLGLTVRHRSVRTGTTLYNLAARVQVGDTGAVSQVMNSALSASELAYIGHLDINPDTGLEWTPSEINDLRLRLLADAV